MLKRFAYKVCLIGVLAVSAPAWATTVYVDADSTCSSSCGGTWAAAYPELQDGVDAASTSDEVWVAEGTYSGTITLKNGVAVYGGFDGTETSASDSNPDTYITNIQGGTSTPALTSDGNDATAVLRGFHIIDGETPSLEGGGGLHIENGSPMIINCTFKDNATTYMGAAVSLEEGGSPRFVNCKFFHNDADIGGSVIWTREGSPTFENCLMYENTGGGSALISMNGVMTLRNCTVADNTATYSQGGGLYDDNGTAIVDNCIFWNNVSVAYDSDEIYHYKGATLVTYSDVKGGWTGTGNIDSDPKFVNATGDNYELKCTRQVTSPCRGAGSDTLVPADVGDLDWDSNTTETTPFDVTVQTVRQFNTVDMGAYEWTPTQQ